MLGIYLIVWRRVTAIDTQYQFAVQSVCLSFANLPLKFLLGPNTNTIGTFELILLATITEFFTCNCDIRIQLCT
jgi:hypothetical protein